MSSPAAMFVTYMPEEDCFWMLERVLSSSKYGHLAGFYEPGASRPTSATVPHRRPMFARQVFRCCSSTSTSWTGSSSAATLLSLPTWSAWTARARPVSV